MISNYIKLSVGIIKVSLTLQILEKYVFSEFDLYRLILPKTPRYYFGLRF
jgi:hypothetical protein